MGRCGARTQDDLLPIAEAIAASPGLRLRGLQAYEGHCMLEPDPDTRLPEAAASNQKATDATSLLAEQGHACTDISAGGTGLLHHRRDPGITEVQAGSYVMLDRFHGDPGARGFEVALVVLGTVVSRQGNTVVLDCGRKSVGIDFVTPPRIGHPDAVIRYYAEEHCLVDFPGVPAVDLGDRAEVIVGYGPTTVNLHDGFHGVVSDIWPVNPRGAGRPAFH